MAAPSGAEEKAAEVFGTAGADCTDRDGDDDGSAGRGRDPQPPGSTEGDRMATLTTPGRRPPVPFRLGRVSRVPVLTDLASFRMYATGTGG